MVQPATRFLTYFVLPLFLASCATSIPEITRLNPVPVESKAPALCRLISIVPGSPAEKAGLNVGDQLERINDKKPVDAWDAGEMVNQSPDSLQVVVLNSSAAPRTLQIPLNKNRPRLGAACDLSDFRKHGVTAAGNESQTVFQGPYALTASGIVDKGIIFVRLRLANNSAKELSAGPDRFNVQDSAGKSRTLLSPKEVICDMFGDRGARQLALNRRKRESTEYDPGAMAREETCGAAPVTGKLKNVDASFVETNADYLARESLWSTTLKPGATADGVIYLREAGASLPVRVQTIIDGYTLDVGLGARAAVVTEVVPEQDLEKFFLAQKKNAPLRITLRKDNKVFVGRFSSYDAVDEVIWFNTPSGNLLNSTSIPLRTILNAQSVESTN